MNTPSPHIDIDFIENMRSILDDMVVVGLLEEFVKSLQQTRDELDKTPQDSTDAVRFQAVKFRGMASEYGANRLAQIARTMEQSLKQGSRNAVDWRLLLRAEIDETISLYRDMIGRLQTMPAANPKLKLASWA
jgi:HPt (histidine-containing phosphotransfer) domain-containing protein